jgi:putative two-component system response regulator
LLKPGKLAPEEFEIMKTHVTIGERILSTPCGPCAVSATIRHHHERWDGSANLTA